MSKRYILIILFANFFCSSGTAQAYRIFGFNEDKGLSSFNVLGITQDKQGFIWINTQDGLNRFDGEKFTVYSKTSKTNISGNECKDSYYDSALNLLWVCTSNGGIDALDVTLNKIVYTLSYDSIRKHFPDAVIRKAIKLTDGRMIFGSENGFLTIKYFKNNQPAKVAYFNNNISVFEFLPCQNKLFVFGYDHKIRMYSDEMNLLKEFSMGDDKDIRRLISANYDKNTGEIRICSEGGLYSFNTFTYETVKISLINYIGIPYSLAVKNANSIIVATDKGIYETNKSFQHFKRVEFLYPNEFRDWDLSITRIFIDKYEQLWYGGRKGLFLQENKPSPYIAYTSDPINKTNLGHLYYLHFLEPAIVIACNIKGLYRVNLINRSIEELDNKYLYYYFFEVRGLGRFVSREDGLFVTHSFNKLRLSKIGSQFQELKSIENFKFATHLCLNDSLVILGTDENKSVFVWNTVAKKIYNVNDFNKKLESFYTNGLVKVDEGNFLIATDREVAIFNVQEKTFRTINIYDAFSKRVDLFLDCIKVKNEYWIASYSSGIFILDSLLKQKHFINTQSGLSNDGVYKMIFDGKNHVWVTTNYGLNRINISTFQVANFYAKDGLHGNAFEEYSANIHNDSIIVGGPNGFTLINPKLVIAKRKPESCIYLSAKLDNGVFVDEINLLNQQKLVVENTIFKVDISVVSMNFDLSSIKSIYYKISEINDIWINNGNSSIISLIGISPGTYHLQVKATNEDGVWSEPKELILKFLPKWYQTWWFYLLIVLSIAGLLYALYRYRIAQIKKQHEIRKNIATDLHDDLGSTLNSVKVFTNLAISGVKQEESLQQVKDNLTEATMSLRDMIWVLDDSLDTVDELITRLKQFAIPVAAASNIEAVIKADSEVNNRQLIKEEKRNLFLICKEAINNSIKYSGTSQIDVAITASGKKIQIVVADNGKGFNLNEVKKGYGLKNMQYRAGQIKYKVVLQSAPAKGTQIIIQPQ